MRILILSIFFLLSLLSSAQITIEGNAPSHRGKYVSLLTIEDYLTYSYKSLGKTKVDSSGKFSFQVNENKAFKAIIEIEEKSAILYIDPDTKSYKINFPSGKNTTGNIVQLIFEDLPDDDLNTLVLEFNFRLDNFLYGDTTSMMRLVMQDKPFKDSLDVFKNELLTHYKSIKKEFFHNYIKYSIASLEQLSTGKDIAINRINVFNNFIKDKPLLYKNDAYMTFFNQFYENSLRLPVKGGKDKLYLAINNNASKSMLNEIFVNDVFLKDERIRELVMIKGLGEEYYYENFIKENILSILYDIEKESAFPENRIIAKNTIKLLTNLQIGYRAPDFSLKTNHGDTITLDSLKGKYAYIGFWATWNSPSLLEMEIAQKLEKEYGKYVEFISISVDKDEQAYKNFLKNHPKYNWHFSHYEGEVGMLTDYRIKSLPEYFLIDPDGNILQAPALKPSPNGDYQSIDQTLFEIKKKLEPKKIRVIGGKG